MNEVEVEDGGVVGSGRCRREGYVRVGVGEQERTRPERPNAGCNRRERSGGIGWMGFMVCHKALEMFVSRVTMVISRQISFRGKPTHGNPCYCATPTNHVRKSQ